MSRRTMASSSAMITRTGAALAVSWLTVSPDLLEQLVAPAFEVADARDEGVTGLAIASACRFTSPYSWAASGVSETSERNRASSAASDTTAYCSSRTVSSCGPGPGGRGRRGSCAQRGIAAWAFDCMSSHTPPNGPGIDRSGPEVDPATEVRWTARTSLRSSAPSPARPTAARSRLLGQVGERVRGQVPVRVAQVAG